MSPTPASPEATEGQLKPLPCPFCGKAPHSAWHDAGAPGMEDCGFWGIDCCHAFSHEDSEDEAVAAWNTRARSAHADIEAGDASLAAYKAENAKHGWSGRGYGFDPFSMALNKDGGATIGFNEDDANWEQDDESSRQYIYCNVAASEIIALRDYLNEAFPVEAGAPAGDAVAVKPLEWNEPTARTNGCFTADTPFGNYSLVNEDGWSLLFEPGRWWEWSGDRIIDTIDTAKRAAQAHLESLIAPLFAHPSPPIDGDREAVSSLRNMGVLDPSPPIDGLVAFLNQAARYFENRPTGGEDSAHWANVYNTENARKAAAALSRLDGLVERNPTEHEEWLTRQSTLDRHRVLVLEKRLAASDAAVLALTTALLRAREELEQWFDAAEVLKIIDAALSQAQPTAPEAPTLVDCPKCGRMRTEY